MAAIVQTPEDLIRASGAEADLRRQLEDPAFESVADERLRLVERIAHSEPFQKSSRLPTLLRYLAHCTIANDRPGLTEQAIGRAVFDKPKDFHPTEDSSVRVYVRQLRLRLHEYYQSVGQADQIVIELPKGGYSLAFHYRHTLPVPSEARPVPLTLPVAALPVEGSSEQSGAKQGRSAIWIPWGLFFVALLCGAAGWYRFRAATVRNLPQWPINQVVEPDRQTSMVLADGSYALRLLGDREITLDEYADHHFADNLIPPHATEGEQRLFGYLRSAQITSMADARAATALTALAGSLQSNLVMRSAKELNGSMLTSGNLILVGAKTSNPWAELYEDRLNFRLVEDGLRGPRYISNRSPQPGEHAAYTLTGPTGISGDDYATLSLVPGMGGQGSVLLLQGLRLEGTEAAIRFLSSEEDRSSLMEKLKAANGGSVPQYFEALLHAHSMGGSAASVDCLAVRVVSRAKR